MSHRVAIFDHDQCVARVGLDHHFTDEVRLFDQLPRRRALVKDFLDTHVGDGHLDAVVGRGGLLPPCRPGPTWSPRSSSNSRTRTQFLPRVQQADEIALAILEPRE
jgi:butyrate kinase